MATISDVCKMAGVSKATVSRVINGTGQVKSSTREHVEAVMKELNYKPNSLAQALANSSGNSIGLVLSDFDGNYFGSLLKQASLSADKMGKKLLIADGKNQADLELEAIQSLVDKKCDVIVLYSRRLTSEQLIELNNSIDIPIVHVGRQLPNQAGYSIAFDQEKAIADALEHLLTSGHRQIAYFGPDAMSNTTRLRLSTFKSVTAAKSHLGLTTDIFCCNFSLESGYQIANDVLDSHFAFSAIVAASDDIAIGILRACREKGINVPEQLSIVSIDNEKMSEFVTPKLTTVNIPISHITEKAMLVAQEYTQGKTPDSSELISGQLIIRESTKPL